MNYDRIYAEFIDNRRSRPAPIGYSEVHHVIPRSMGGADDADNLIRLSAEDHFVAHLLLAKMHGGGMWSAVRRMRWGRVGGERPWVAGRPMYAFARAKQAALTSARCKGQRGHRGRENGRFKTEVLVWTNLDTGQIRRAAKGDMLAEFGGCRAHWTSAAHGQRRSHQGWTTRPEDARIRGLKGVLLRFANDDGRAFTGTQKDLCSIAGISAATACRVARNGQTTLNGWRLDTECLPQPEKLLQVG